MAAKDEEAEAEDKAGKQNQLHCEGIFNSARERGARTAAARFSGSEAASNQFATF